FDDHVVADLNHLRTLPCENQHDFFPECCRRVRDGLSGLNCMFVTTWFPLERRGVNRRGTSHAMSVPARGAAFRNLSTAYGQVVCTSPQKTRAGELPGIACRVRCTSYKRP